jgi:hypothetical protein
MSIVTIPVPRDSLGERGGLLGDPIARQQQVAADQQHRVGAVEVK